MIQSGKTFLETPRQSSIFLAHLKLVCQNNNFKTFYPDLEHFMDEQGIYTYLSKTQIHSIFLKISPKLEPIFSECDLPALQKEINEDKSQQSPYENDIFTQTVFHDLESLKKPHYDILSGLENEKSLDTPNPLDCLSCPEEVVASGEIDKIF